MGSILPEFTYDIFISYRQKDNKYDEWVTQFVDNLKRELDATQKEEISVYFDANPHDGIHETHDVDDTLREKLKCLIFIPIVSKTYCDTNCFAWQYEFLKFMEAAKSDEHGLKIKLANGNVASRVLPVRIHDLDKEDLQLFSRESGGPLRSVDFVYKESGVNRPLQPTDDPSSNQYHTSYRNQINKVANSIGDLVKGFKTDSSDNSDESEEPEAFVERRFRKRTFLVPLLIAIMSVMAIYMGYIIFFDEDRIARDPSELGIAVLPFQNQTNDDEQDYIGILFRDAIHTRLAQSRQFAFLSSQQATFMYRETHLAIVEIGKELDVDYILSGRYFIADNTIQINVEFADTKTGYSVWNESYSVPFDNINVLEIQGEIAEKIVNKFISLKKLTEESKAELASKLSEITGLSFDSYKYYVAGLEWLEKGPFVKENLENAIGQFKLAVQKDSLNSEAWIKLIRSQSDMLWFDMGKSELLHVQINQELEFIEKNLPSWVSDLSQGIYKYRGQKLYSEGQKHLDNAFRLFPNSYDVNNLLGAIHLRKIENSKGFEYLKKLSSLQPNSTVTWMNLSVCFIINGDYNNAVRAMERGFALGIDSSAFQTLLSLYSSAGKEDYQIPMQYRQDNKRYLITKYWWFSHPDTAIDQLRNLPKDLEPGSGKYSFTEYYSNLAELYFSVSQDDSAKYFARKAIEQNDGQLIEEPDWVARTYAILGDLDHAEELISQNFTVDSEDLLLQAWHTINSQLKLVILSKNYDKASDLLTRFNKQYPEFADFAELSLPTYNRARRESVKFENAVNSLTPAPPLLSDEDDSSILY